MIQVNYNRSRRTNTMVETMCSERERERKFIIEPNTALATNNSELLVNRQTETPFGYVNYLMKEAKRENYQEVIIRHLWKSKFRRKEQHAGRC